MTVMRALWDRPFVLLTMTAIFWAGNAIAARAAVGELSPFALTFLRWVIVLSLFAALFGRQILAHWPTLRQRLVYLFLMGSIGFTAFNAAFYIAAHHTTAINLGIIQGAMPIFVLIGAFVAFGTPIRALQAIGVLVTMIGVVIVAAGGELARLMTLVFNRGDILMLIAATFYAAYAVFLPRKPNVPGLVFFAALAFSALIGSLPLLAYEAATGTLQWPTPFGWLIVAYVSMFPSMLSQIFFIRGVELIGPGRAGVFINLVPVFASILSIALLGERFELYHLAALVFVLGGIWLAEQGKVQPVPVRRDQAGR